MDASDSTAWNQELIDEYVDEHPHNEKRHPSKYNPTKYNPTKIILIQVTINE